MENWEKFKILSTALVPVVIGFVGHWYTSAISEREVQAKFVELGVSILQSPPSPGTENVRKWATEILTAHSGVKIDEDTRKDLVERVSLPTMLGSIDSIHRGLRHGTLTARQAVCILKEEGYLKSDIVQVGDEEFRVGITRFQSDHGLMADGILGGKTADTLKKLASDECLSLSQKVDEFGEIETPPETGGTSGGNSTRDLILESFGTNKVAVIKAVRDATGMGLKDAKDLVDSAPTVVIQNVPLEDAKKLKKDLEEAGAKVRFE